MHTIEPAAQSLDNLRPPESYAGDDRAIGASKTSRSQRPIMRAEIKIPLPHTKASIEKMKKGKNRTDGGCESPLRRPEHYLTAEAG